MRKASITLLLLGVMSATPAVTQANITLGTTIRDFQSSHPDFEDGLAQVRQFGG